MQIFIPTVPLTAEQQHEVDRFHAAELRKTLEYLASKGIKPPPTKEDS
jgi:hypothetical protein